MIQHIYAWGPAKPLENPTHYAAIKGRHQADAPRTIREGPYDVKPQVVEGLWYHIHGRIHEPGVDTMAIALAHEYVTHSDWYTIPEGHITKTIHCTIIDDNIEKHFYGIFQGFSVNDHSGRTHSHTKELLRKRFIEIMERTGIPCFIS